MQRGTRLERDETILENTSPWLMFSQAALLPLWFLAQSTLSLNLALDLLLALHSPPPTPLAAPVEQCAWCWSQFHPGQPYPEHWSSMTCALHGAALNWQRVERRKRRLTHAVTSN